MNINFSQKIPTRRATPQSPQRAATVREPSGCTPQPTPPASPQRVRERSRRATPSANGLPIGISARHLLLQLVVTFTLIVPPAAFAQRSDALLPEARETARLEAAVDRALSYLASTQEPEGWWPHGVNRRGPNNGINAICLLALLGGGHAPDRGPYKEVIDRAINYIVATQTDEGLFLSPGQSHGPMYEHGLATLAIIEAHGYKPSVELRRRAQKAVDLIVHSQNHEGGWRYHPRPSDADLSVTVMQVVALRAAVNARLHVPDSTFENAIEYVQRCAVPEGGFAYQPGHHRRLAQSAAGALSLQLLGAHDDPRIADALEYLQEAEYEPAMDSYFLYMNYYAMQAHFQAGGEQWARYHGRVRNFLLNNQREDGSWPGFSEEKFNAPDAASYSTAFAAMTLQVYLHYLPAYQR